MSKVVVVIGGSSGIGLATALEHANRHDHVVLASRSAQALDVAAAQCREAGASSARTVVADVGSQDDVSALVTDTMARHGRIDGLVLAAAVIAYGEIEHLAAEVFEHIVATDIFGTANVARAILPVFRQQGRGVLIVVNTLVGSVTVPSMGSYAVAKWGQLALARTLQQELRNDRSMRNVHVCIVTPGSVNTPIYYQAGNILGRAARPPWPVRQPEAVGKILADLLDRPRRHVSVKVGVTNPLIVSGFRLFPALYDALVGPLFRRLSLAGKPVAHNDGNVLVPIPEAERVHGRWPAPKGDR